MLAIFRYLILYYKYFSRDNLNVIRQDNTITVLKLYYNKILLKYHTSWYYGIQQNWSVLLRIRPKEFF